MATTPLKLRRARAIHFELEDGRSLVVPAPSIAQIADCMALDPAGDSDVESPSARLLRIIEQVKVCIPDKQIVGTLTFEEAQQILQAIFAHVHGYDPADHLALQALLQKKSVSRAKTITPDASRESTA